MTYNLRHTISDWQRARLQKLGATVSDNVLTATEQQLWDGRIIGRTCTLLKQRDQVTITDSGSGGGGAFVLQLGGLNIQLGGQDLTLGA